MAIFNQYNDYMPRRLAAIIILALVSVHVYLGWSFIKASAPTYDEPVHLASGYSYLATGKYRLNIRDHPPLAEMISAVPLLFRKVRLFSGHTYFITGQLYHYGNLFLYKNIMDAEKMLNSSRLFSLLFWTVLLSAVIWLWGNFIGGINLSVWAMIIFAFFPAFISINSLVTTDSGGAVFFFISFFFAWLAFNFSTTRNFKPSVFFALSGVFTGLALASKFNMFILPPLVIGLAVFENVRSKRFKWTELAVFFSLYILSAFLVLAAVYRFNQLDLYFEGLGATLGRLQDGRSSFVLGKYSISGRWWYFPLALAVKIPFGVLLLAAVGLILTREKIRRGYLWLAIPPAIYFAIALAARVQIGYRHILPMFPFLVLLAGAGADFLFQKGRRIKWIPAALCLWMAVSVLNVHPHYLAYFSEISGGPSNGYKVLVDSNLDWGQGLKALAAFLKKEGNPPVYLSYFGVADPAYYGISYIPLAFISNVKIEPALPAEEDSGKWDRLLLAVSATNLQSTYYSYKNVFGWLKARKPVYSAGHSIFVYDLTKDREGLVEIAGIFGGVGMRDESEKLLLRAKGL